MGPEIRANWKRRRKYTGSHAGRGTLRACKVCAFAAGGSWSSSEELEDELLLELSASPTSSSFSEPLELEDESELSTLSCTNQRNNREKTIAIPIQKQCGCAIADNENTEVA